MSRPGLGAGLCILGVLVIASVPRWTHAVPYGAVIASEAETPSIAWTIADGGWHGGQSAQRFDFSSDRRCHLPGLSSSGQRGDGESASPGQCIGPRTQS
jgi:hypothetical protein